jgi:hypothetical protein
VLQQTEVIKQTTSQQQPKKGDKTNLFAVKATTNAGGKTNLREVTATKKQVIKQTCVQ